LSRGRGGQNFGLTNNPVSHGEKKKRNIIEQRKSKRKIQKGFVSEPVRRARMGKNKKTASIGTRTGERESQKNLHRGGWDALNGKVGGLDICVRQLTSKTWGDYNVGKGSLIGEKRGGDSREPKYNTGRKTNVKI